MHDKGLDAIIRAAIKAASDRSKDLSQA